MRNSNEGQKDSDFCLHTASSSRPPQFNQSICGCRCGRRSSHGKGYDDNEHNEDEAMTLVASDASDEGGSAHLMGLMVSDNTLQSALIQETRLRFNRPHMVFDSPGTTAVSSPDRSRPASSYEGTAESMENEPGSGKCSKAHIDSCIC